MATKTKICRCRVVDKMVGTRSCCCRRSWQIRNNSANILAVMKPSQIFDDDVQHCLSENTCYCQEKGTPPQLFSRPKQCIFENDGGDIRSIPLICVPNAESSSPFKRKSTTTQNSPLTRSSINFVQFKNQRADQKVKLWEHKDMIENYKSKNFDETEDSRSSSPHRFVSNMGDKINLNDAIPKHLSTEFPRTNFFNTNQNDTLHQTNHNEISSKHFSESFARNASSLDRAYEQTEKGHRSSEQFLSTHQSDIDQLKNPISCNNYYTRGVNSYNYENFESGRDGNAIKSNFRESSPMQLSNMNEFRKERNTIISESKETEQHQSNTEKQAYGKKMQKSDLKQLSNFRQDHYFETHSSEDLIKSIPEHICVHRFGLDYRFLPKALHTDVYNTSRCIICDKPMENSAVNKFDERSRKKAKGIFPRFYKYGLAPKKIYMANNNNIRIEMVLEGHKRREYACKPQKRPSYFNTYALRYQRGVSRENN